MHNFAPSDGTYPMQIAAADSGSFVGITFSGGAYGYGTVFQITSSGVLTVLHSFGDGTDGQYPEGFVIDASGNILGGTDEGGADRYGMIFELSPNGHGGYNYASLYSFTNGADGEGPQTQYAVDSSKRLLYGAAIGGGNFLCNPPYDNGCGTIFKLSY